MSNDDYGEALEIIENWADDKRVLWTGSRAICDPPPPETADVDLVVIYNGALSHHLQTSGFDITPHEEYPNDNIKACYRKGLTNIIAVEDAAAFDLWRKATDLAAHMNLREKHQRVALFQFITEGRVRDTEITYDPKSAVTVAEGVPLQNLLPW